MEDTTTTSTTDSAQQAVDPAPPTSATPPAGDIVSSPPDVAPPAADVPPRAIDTGHPDTGQPTGTIRRSRSDRVVAGVCGGLAKTLGVDPLVLRLGLVVATLLGFGLGLLIYLACWVLMPEE